MKILTISTRKDIFSALPEAEKNKLMQEPLSIY